MTRRYPTILGPVVLAAVAAAILASPTPASAQATPLFNYSVKFVCGLQKPLSPNEPGEPVVKPGNYATEINIHNIQFNQLTVFKQVVLVVRDGEPVGREPRVQPPTPFVAVPMPPRNAMMDDCNQLWSMAFPGSVPPNPMPLTIGYLSIISLSDIDVDGVYTTQVFRPTAPLEVLEAPSIDVERVLAKRISVTGATAKVASALRSKQ